MVNWFRKARQLNSYLNKGEHVSLNFVSAKPGSAQNSSASYPDLKQNTSALSH